MPRQGSKQPITESRFLQPCDIELETFKPAPFMMLIFGGTGDLSRRKLLPALYRIYQAYLIENFSIIGVSLEDFSDQQYRAFAQEATKQFAKDDYHNTDWKSFSEHLFYVSGDITKKDVYNILCKRIEEFVKPHQTQDLMYYLAIPPNLMLTGVNNLAMHKLCRSKPNARIVIEKPFGRNRKTAEKLNQKLLAVFDERQIYRIDHYLGKETVQNLLFFRFANSIFEPLWNRNYIDHIQITVAETLGVEKRAKFYEKTGVIRDIVQNHIMQLIAMIAMEPPVGFEADLIRDEKVKVFRAIRTMNNAYIRDHIIVAQYEAGNINNQPVPAYRQEEGVSSDSIIPTYFAGKFHIDNWRWADVPIYVRTGKRLIKKATYLVVVFKQPPLKLLGRVCDVMAPNKIIMRIQPQETIALHFSVKHPGTVGRSQQVEMMFNYHGMFHVKHLSAYERLLIDFIKADQTLFARQDGIEAMWGIVDPIVDQINRRKKVPTYEAGTWGPSVSDQFIEKNGRKWENL